jgi:release factor glutamine methyltransferase
MSTEQPWTIARLREWTTGHLKKKGVESAAREAELLLAHALGCPRIQLFTRYDEEPTVEERQRYRELVQQRLQGRPVAYLLGRKEFFSLDFEVNPAVLIPRPDTEWLVTECLSLAKEAAEPAVLDVGTGSGCLAVAVARQHKGAKVTAVDISAAALAVAGRNAERHGVADRIRFLHGDLFSPLASDERFDFILSNPPYIPSGMWSEPTPTVPLAALASDVRDHEPRLALDGGADGFAVFDRLIAAAPQHLKPGGWLLVEIGADQEEAARARIEGRAGYDLGKTVHDLAGHPRVLRVRWQG